jgi:integrase
VGYGDLTTFRVDLLRKGLSVKTVRNIIDGSFRALYRDARAEYDELKGRDPFIDLQWPASQRNKPEAFTPAERDRIIQHFIENNFFYFPWVFTLFHTGMRPSEASALTWQDVHLDAMTISISKSRYMGTDSAPKTSKSARTIKITDAVADVLRLLPSRELGIRHVFVNKLGDPMNSKKWAEHNWAEPLKELGIDHRKFYCTRHTFITTMIARRENPMAVAPDCGTSVQMIMEDYCGPLELGNQETSATETSHSTELRQSAENPLRNMVAGPGFEPGTSRL